MGGIRTAVVLCLLVGVPRVSAAQIPESPGRFELAFGGGARIGGSDTLAIAVFGPTATVNVHPRLAAELALDFVNRPGRLFGGYLLQGRVAVLRPMRFPMVFVTAGAAGTFDHHSWYGWTENRPDGSQLVYPSGSEWLVDRPMFAGGAGIMAHFGPRVAVRCDVQYAQTSLRVTGGVSVSLGSTAHKRP